MLPATCADAANLMTGAGDDTGEVEIISDTDLARCAFGCIQGFGRCATTLVLHSSLDSSFCLLCSQWSIWDVIAFIHSSGKAAGPLRAAARR